MLWWRVKSNLSCASPTTPGTFACRFGNFGALVLPAAVAWVDTTHKLTTGGLNSLTTVSSTGQPSFMQISNLDLGVSDVIGLKSCCNMRSMYFLHCIFHGRGSSLSFASKMYYANSAPAEGVLTTLSEGGVGPDCVAKKIRYTFWAPCAHRTDPICADWNWQKNRSVLNWTHISSINLLQGEKKQVLP